MKSASDIADFVKNLLKSYTVTETVSQEEKDKSLKLIIEEQKADYDYLLHIYNRMRATESILLTAIFAVIAYLFHNTKEGRLSIADRFFIPTEDYGRVILVIAAIFFLYGAVKLTLNVFGKNPWETAYESAKDNYSYGYTETLKYIKARYDTCHEYNAKCYKKRKDELNFLFYCLLISGIILCVIKTIK